MAERAVRHGLSLAKFVGAKVTVIIVEERLGGWLYTEQIKEHTASVLDLAANAAQVRPRISIVPPGIKNEQCKSAMRGPGVRE